MAAPAAPSLDLVSSLATADDEWFLAALFLEARPELALISLDGPMFEELIAMQRRAQRLSYAAAYPGNQQYVVRAAGHPVAMVIRHEADAVVRVLDLAVAASSRERGIGTRVLSDLIAATAKPVELSVAIGNPARELYERLGFVECGRTDTDIALRLVRPEGPAT